jgi:hypothetical protein
MKIIFAIHLNEFTGWRIVPVYQGRNTKMRKKKLSKKELDKFRKNERRFYEAAFRGEFLKILDTMKINIMNNPKEKKLYDEILHSYVESISNVMKSEKLKEINPRMLISTHAESLITYLVFCDFCLNKKEPKKE